MNPPFPGQAVELRITPIVRLFPFGFDEAPIFQSMQSGIEGTSWNLNDLAGNLLQPLGNRIAMRRLDGDDFQEEEIERTLGKIGLRGGIDHSFSFYLLVLRGEVEAQAIELDSRMGVQKSSYENMPEIAVYPHAASISPTGQLLAVGGGSAFQLFHFNGSAPVTTFSPAIAVDDNLLEFGWDQNNHLFSLSGSSLFVYTVTPTSIEQTVGSPISIPGAGSVIVVAEP
jgi:hypothetical protein